MTNIHYIQNEIQYMSDLYEFVEVLDIPQNKQGYGILYRNQVTKIFYDFEQYTEYLHQLLKRVTKRVKPHAWYVQNRMRGEVNV